MHPIEEDKFVQITLYSHTWENTIIIYNEVHK